jgi:hypothetical protein
MPLRAKLSKKVIHNLVERYDSAFDGMAETGDTVFARMGHIALNAVDRKTYTVPNGSFRVSHYTNMEAFISIVKSGSFRFYDTRYMNDAIDYTFGREAMSSHYDKYRAEIESVVENIRPVDVAFQLHTAVARSGLDYTYALCTTRSQDGLSQWMTYAGKNGVELIFGFKSLENFLDYVPTPKSSGAMVYTSKRQASMLIQLFEAIAAGVIIAQRKGFDTDDDEWCWGIEKLVSYFSWRLKSEQFASEKEVRFIHVTTKFAHSDDEFCFEPKGGYIRSYWQAPEKPQRRLPLLGVRIAPGPSKSERMHSVRSFLASEGYGRVEVTESSVPLRYFE